jgi:hypothetical protein
MEITIPEILFLCFLGACPVAPEDGTGVSVECRNIGAILPCFRKIKS